MTTDFAVFVKVVAVLKVVVVTVTLVVVGVVIEAKALCRMMRNTSWPVALVRQAAAIYFVDSNEMVFVAPLSVTGLLIIPVFLGLV